MSLTAGGVALTTAQIASIVSTLGLQTGPIAAVTYNTDGTVSGYSQNSIAYTFTYTGGVLATKVGGGKTITYVYSGGKFDHEVVS